MKQLVTLYSLIVPTLISAQGYLDPTFGAGGYVTLDIQGSYEQFKDLAVQPDGKIIAAGHASLSFVTCPLLARFTADGVLDPSFNGTGWATGPDTTWDSPGDYEAMALQPDGRFVCVGRARITLTDFKVLVARYLPDGTLDPSFGTGGYVLHGSPNNTSWYANDVVLTPGNGIRICGRTDEDPNNDLEFLVLGLLPDGSLDPSFGIGGVVNFHPGGPSIDCVAYALAVQSDGRLVVATEGQVDTTGYVTIWGFRLNADGTLDTSFGENGLVINYNEGDMAYDVAIGPNDEVLLVGFGSIFASLNDLVTMQLDADGQSAVETVYEYDDDETLSGQGAWIQDDGEAIALGFTGSDTYILRRLSDGSLDPSFGAGGIVSDTTVNIEGNNGGFWLEDNGRMLVCDRSGVVPGNGDDAIIMAFYPYPVGINETGAEGSLSVSPNPGTDHFNIGIAGGMVGSAAVIELFDATRRRVLSKEVPRLSRNAEIELPSTLREGLYLVMLRTGGHQPRSARVIIQR